MERVERWAFFLKGGVIPRKGRKLMTENCNARRRSTGDARSGPSIPLVSGGKMASVLILGVGPCPTSALLRTCTLVASRAVCAWYDGVSTRGTSVRRSIPIRDDDDIARPLGWELKSLQSRVPQEPVKICGRNFLSSFRQVLEQVTRKLVSSVTSFQIVIRRNNVSNVSVINSNVYINRSDWGKNANFLPLNFVIKISNSDYQTVVNWFSMVIEVWDTF